MIVRESSVKSNLEKLSDSQERLPVTQRALSQDDLAKPRTNERAIAAAVGGSRCSVSHVVQRQGFHPYHLQRVPSQHM
ncbi:hypothetical protein TNCV_4461391 [Trichonephila clavipes]|nr:hypothetical protein TNCV_4461391 [Trichonephila clavipes]